MRADGKTLRAIASALGVSLSSASLWTRDVAIPKPPLAKVAPRTETEAEQGNAHCGRCDRELPVAFFHRSGQGRQSWCRPCRGEYMRERGELHRRQTHEARARRREIARRYVFDLRSRSCCADCGLSDPDVFEFDHVGPKRANVADLVSGGYSLQAIQRDFDHVNRKRASVLNLVWWEHSIASIEQEIAECEVRCANCHRRRTCKTRRHFRNHPVPPP